MKQSSEFAVLMCLSDGTGPTLKGTAASAKALQLANFHSRPHLKQFLDFFFDRGFSPKNPTTKFTRAWMEFGGPMKGFHKRSSGHNSATGKNEQEEEFVRWFMEDIRHGFQEKTEAPEPHKTTGGQVEITYLL